MKEHHLKFKKSIKKSRMNQLDEQLDSRLFVKKDDASIESQRVTKIDFENLDDSNEDVYEASIQHQKFTHDDLHDSQTIHSQTLNRTLNRTSHHISLVNFYFIDDTFMSFVDVYRENDDDDEDSSHDSSHDDFNREDHKNFKSLEANDHHQFERQQFMNFDLMFQILIIDNTLHDKRSLDFASKKRNHIKSHD